MCRLETITTMLIHLDRVSCTIHFMLIHIFLISVNGGWSLMRGGGGVNEGMYRKPKIVLMGNVPAMKV